MRKRTTQTGVIMLFMGALAACGQKGPLEPPPESAPDTEPDTLVQAPALQAAPASGSVHLVHLPES